MNDRQILLRVLEYLDIKKSGDSYSKISSKIHYTVEWLDGDICLLTGTFGDLRIHVGDIEPEMGKTRIIQQILHLLICRRDPVLDSFPSFEGVMSLSQPEYIVHLLRQIYKPNDLSQRLMRESGVLSIGGMNEQKKVAKITVNGVELIGEGLQIKDARHQALSSLFSYLAENAMSPPREQVNSIPIRTNVEPKTAIQTLEKHMPNSTCTIEPIFTSKEKTEVKKWLAKYHANGQIFYGSAHTPAEAQIEDACIAVHSLGIVNDPALPPNGSIIGVGEMGFENDESNLSPDDGMMSNDVGDPEDQ